jgi:DNA repair protein RecN (Recombination protein N)
MLRSLSIRNVVLIERLDLGFDAGLCVLTGETGSGKSILLDSLGLAIGVRADADLVASGAGQSAVAAEFDIAERHPARTILKAQGIDDEGALVLRRVVSESGRSRAFINDQPVSVALLRRCLWRPWRARARGGGSLACLEARARRACRSRSGA